MAFESVDIRQRIRRRQGASGFLPPIASIPEPSVNAEPMPFVPGPATPTGGGKVTKPKHEINKRMLILALACAAVASLMVVSYVRSSAGVLANQSKLIKVAVLAKDVAGRTALTADQVTYKEVPALYVAAGTVSGDDPVVGKVALTDLFAGETLHSKRLSEPNAATGVAVKIPVGHRAMAMANQLSGLLKPGDYVDVYATLIDTADKAHTVPVLQRSLVLAVGGKINATDEAPTGYEGASKATLAVPDAKVHLLTLMEDKGNFRLVLRAPNDTTMAKVKFNDKQLLTMLVGQDEAPKPKAKPVAVVRHAAPAPVYRAPVYHAPRAVSRPAPVYRPAPAPRSNVVVTVINGGNVQQQSK